MLNKNKWFFWKSFRLNNLLKYVCRREHFYMFIFIYLFIHFVYNVQSFEDLPSRNCLHHYSFTFTAIHLVFLYDPFSGNQVADIIILEVIMRVECVYLGKHLIWFQILFSVSIFLLFAILSITTINSRTQ